MKKLLLLTFAIILSITADAQCDQLFLSGYVVGTGNNKAYEIYNPTPNDIDLAPYVLQRWSNGSNSSTDQTILAGTIPAYGTWVVANGQTEDIDLGTFISPKCDPALQALADQLDAPYPAPTFMNGNDALVLLDGGEICDIFGKPGEDPGEAWTSPDGTFITSGHTLIRKQDVLHGVTMVPVVYHPLAEWDTLPADTWTNLGMHTCNCDPSVGIEEATPLDIKVYPTLLTSNTPIKVETNHVITRVEVYDITGKRVGSDLNITSSGTGTINLPSLSPGAYILNIYMNQNVTFSTRFVIQ